jgi:FKBP-type peptidyl-prolyl cis-trans isomerase
MLRSCFTLLFCVLFVQLSAQKEDVLLQRNSSFTGFISYPVADTVRATTFHNEFIIATDADKRNGSYIVAGFSRGWIGFVKEGTEKMIKMILPDTGLSGNRDIRAQLMGRGVNIIAESRSAQVYSWKYNWKTGILYKVMVTALPDTATKTTIYAGYVFLPENGKWKLIASARTSLDGGFLLGLYAVKENTAAKDKRYMADTVSFTSTWLQGNRGVWQELSNRRPVIDLAKNIDSAAQVARDREQIFAAVASKKIDTAGSREGVYYHILKEGTGDYVSVTDTVTVFYKGSLLHDGSIFDQTKEKPATFPLQRLIRGWQLAIPMCRVGGTVRIIIPSGQAYGIRARSKDIPPNSVLVFDVEVVGTKKRL